MGVGIKNNKLMFNAIFFLTQKSYFGCDTPINDKPWVFYYYLKERK